LNSSVESVVSSRYGSPSPSNDDQQGGYESSVCSDCEYSHLLLPNSEDDEEDVKTKAQSRKKKRERIRRWKAEEKLRDLKKKEEELKLAQLAARQAEKKRLRLEAEEDKRRKQEEEEVRRREAENQNKRVPEAEAERPSPMPVAPSAAALAEIAKCREIIQEMNSKISTLKEELKVSKKTIGDSDTRIAVLEARLSAAIDGRADARTLLNFSKKTILETRNKCCSVGAAVKGIMES